MSVMHGVGVAVAFGQRRENDHTDGTVAAAAVSLIPGNENRAVVAVSGGGEDFRNLMREPQIAENPAAAIAAPSRSIVHVIGQGRCDEIVASYGVAFQITRQLG